MRFAVRVTPKGGRDGSDGWALDPTGRPYLKLRVSAPPSEGAANAAVISFLSKALKRPRSRIAILSGETSRLKMIEIEDLTQSELDQAFGPQT